VINILIKPQHTKQLFVLQQCTVYQMKRLP